MEIGSVIFEQEYQNNPVADENAIIKRGWIQRYETELLTADFVKGLKKIMRIDPSIKEKEQNDKFALVVLGIDDGGQIYELDGMHDRMQLSAQVETVMDYAGKWGFTTGDQIHIEDNAYQHALKQEIDRVSKLRQKWYTTKGITTQSDKVFRLKGISGMIENGFIKFRTGGDNTDLIDQLCNFGKTKFDDWADALVGGLEGIRGATPAFLEYLKQRSESAKENPQKSFIDKYKHQFAGFQ
ncbi:MAG: phage terminase large subunit family protein [Candidatus Helarchaeota archaeon]